MLRDHVDVLVDQALRGLGLQGRVAPATGRHGDRLDVGVDRLGTEREGVDVRQRLRDRERIDVAELAGLADRTGGDAGQVDRLVHGAEVGAEVVELRLRLEAALVDEHDVGVLGGQVGGELEVAVAGGEDEVGAVVDHALHHGFGLSGLRHVLGLQHLEVGERFLRPRRSRRTRPGCSRSRPSGRRR